MTSDESMKLETVVKRMEHIREQLDEDGDLSKQERRELQHEYFMLRAKLLARTAL